MGNVLEFYLKMKDMMSSNLVKMAKNAKSTFASVENSIASHVARGGRRAEDSLDKVNRKLREVDRTASSSSFFNGGMLRKLGMGLSVAGIMAFAGNSVKAAMDNEQRVQSFGVLTGSKQRGKDLAAELRDLKQNTIMGASVYQNAQTMMAFGVNDSKVVGNLKMIGDISMGNVDRMQALTLAFSQTASAGKLMGQDLLQYVNAGFNPLQVMSEKWKEFGFTSQKSIGELRAQMEKGQISAAQIAKAFELATSKGGKFHGMMDTMAATAGGRLQMMKGQFAAFQIDAGNALMPVAESLMSVGTNLLEVLHISKTAPQVLMAERAELTAMIGSITQLNEKNEMRGLLLSNLTAKFPDLFSNINKETVTNGELLSMLNGVNAAYEKRIGLASSNLLINTHSKAYREAEADYTRYEGILSLMKQGDSTSLGTAATMLTLKDKVFTSLGFGVSGGTPSEWDFKHVEKWMQEAQAKMATSKDGLSKWTGINSGQKDVADIQRAFDLKNNVAELNAVFKDGKLKNEFLALTNSVKLFKDDNTGQTNYVTSNGQTLSRLRELMTPGAATGGIGGGGITPSSGVSVKAGSDSVGRAVAGGGPRVININGLTMKGADKIEIHNNGKEITAEFISKLEPHVQEMWLRVLNSGASLQ